MTLAEKYEKETGSQADSAGYPTIGYVQWLEAKVSQPHGFSEEDLDDARNCGYDEGWKDGANHMASIL